jgi:hypothetical protein
MSNPQTRYKVNVQGMIVEEVVEEINKFDDDESNESESPSSPKTDLITKHG